MKRFLLSCFTLVTLTACHVDDVPAYEDSYYKHRHHGFGHRHGRNYEVPETRHGHRNVIIVPDSRSRSHHHGHDDRRAPSNYHADDHKQVIIGNGPANSTHGHG